ALDGSAFGLAVARFVARHRELFGASPSVTLIHVVPDLAKITVPGWIEREVPTVIRPEEVAALQKSAFENVFRPAQILLSRAGITPAEVRLVGQSPGDAIAAEATKLKLDLLAMGSLGFGASRHAYI